MVFSVVAFLQFSGNEIHGFPNNSNGFPATFQWLQQVIPGSSEKLLLFFQAGGACFNDVSSREAEAWLGKVKESSVA